MIELELVAAATSTCWKKSPVPCQLPGLDVTRSYERHWTPVHLDFVVESLEQARERVLSAGAVLESDISEHAYGRLAIFADPFGHGLCLIEFNREGYDAPGS